MKRRILYLLILLLGGLIIIFALHFLAARSAGIANHFNRRFLAGESLALIKAVDLGGSAYYIAGVDPGHIYLGNEIAQLSTIVLDTAFGPVRIGTITRAIDFPYNISSGRLLVDSPFFYLNDQVSRFIVRGLIADWKIRELVSGKIFADLAIPLNAQSLVIRTLKGDKMEYVFAKKFISSSSASSVPGIVENQGDGIFSTDGTMVFDARTSRLVYIYFYRNQFICLDTNLNLLYRARTIDTNKLAKIEVVEIKSDHLYTLAAPPRIINKSGCIALGDLFIHSLLKADNESKKAFEGSSVIDAYDFTNGQYRFSFYIPDFRGQKIKDFLFLGNKVIAFAGSHLLLYKTGSVFNDLLKDTAIVDPG